MVKSIFAFVLLVVSSMSSAGEFTGNLKCLRALQDLHNYTYDTGNLRYNKFENMAVFGANRESNAGFYVFTESGARWFRLPKKETGEYNVEYYFKGDDNKPRKFFGTVDLNRNDLTNRLSYSFDQTFASQTTKPSKDSPSLSRDMEIPDREAKDAFKSAVIREIENAKEGLIYNSSLTKSALSKAKTEAQRRELANQHISTRDRDVRVPHREIPVAELTDKELSKLIGDLTKSLGEQHEFEAGAKIEAQNKLKSALKVCNGYGIGVVPKPTPIQPPNLQSAPRAVTH